MKKWTALFLAALLVLLALTGCAQQTANTAPDAAATPLATEAPAPVPVPEVKDLIVLYTNDIHCGNNDAAEYETIAAYKRALQDMGYDVLLVDAGDYVQGGPIGTVSKGAYLIDIMNETGYDLATVGNHEFDYGMEQFNTLVSQASFPIVSCNFMDLKTNQPVLDSYKIFDFNGHKIAFVGVTTPVTITSSTPAYFQDETGAFIYGFCQDKDGSGLYGQVQASVDAARAEGADIVALVAHLGISESTSPWTSSEVITNTTGVNAVIDGHSHSVVNSDEVKASDGQTVLLTQTGTKLQNIGIMRISAEGKISVGLDETTMISFVDKLNSEYSEQMKKVVANSEVDLVINDPKTDVRIVRNAETNLGDLCADAYRYVAGSDVAFINGGGVRAKLKAGDLTYADIINVHPFGNQICVIEATGQQILDALEFGARAVPEEVGGFLQVSGMTYEIDVKTPSTVQTDENKMFVSVEGERRVKNVKVGEADIDPAKTYTLACHDYLLLNQGDGYTMFKDNVVLKNQFMLDNQVLITYITEELGGVVGQDYANPYGQGRIIENN